MQSHGWGNGGKVQEGCVGAALVESGWDSWLFSGPELSPVPWQSTGESPWSRRTDSEDSHSESFFKIQLWELPGCRVALCHASIGCSIRGRGDPCSPSSFSSPHLTAP